MKVNPYVRARGSGKTKLYARRVTTACKIPISKTSNTIFLKRGFVWADLLLYENGLT